MRISPTETDVQHPDRAEVDQCVDSDAATRVLVVDPIVPGPASSRADRSSIQDRQDEIVASLPEDIRAEYQALSPEQRRLARVLMHRQIVVEELVCDGYVPVVRDTDGVVLLRFVDWRAWSKDHKGQVHPLLGFERQQIWETAAESIDALTMAQDLT